MPSRRFTASSLLATTSVAALLLAPPARAQTAPPNPIMGTLPSVTNGVSRTALIVTNATIAGAVANSGTITPGINLGSIAGLTAALTVNNATIGGGISNSGTISASPGGAGIVVLSSTVTSGIVNSGTIAGNVTGIGISNSTITGGITNSGAIISNVFGIGGFTLPPGPPSFSAVTGSIVNSGTITVSGAQIIDIFAAFGGATGGITNSGTITASGSGALAIVGGVAQGTAIGIETDTGPEPGTGPIVNSGTITVSHTGVPGLPGGTAIGIAAGFVLGLASATIAGGVTNAGTITASAPNGAATGILFGAHSIAGGVTNRGTIIATGGQTGFGIEVIDAAPGSTIVGGITNTGTIAGNTAAIDLGGLGFARFGVPAFLHGGPTTINQMGGALIGSVIGFGNQNGDVLNFTGGKIVLSPTQVVSGFGTFRQTGGTLVLGVTASTTPGSFASVSAGAITLGGTLTLAPQASSLFALAATKSTIFKDVFVSDTPIQGAFATVNTTSSLFGVTLTPDAVTPNALDATLALSATGLAASAQDLTQDQRLGLDAPRLLTGAVQDRLVASGGALGEGTLGEAGAARKGVAGFSFGNANVWGRDADQFGTASGTSAAPGYDVNRTAPIIAGIDWRLENDIVTGVAATYVATSARFKDGSHTDVSSYQGAAYAGWAAGALYAFGSAVVSFNGFSTARLLTPFGLPGDATSSPSGQSYQGHAEAGYHGVLPEGGVNVAVTPYAALDYVHATLAGFSETGGFGALSVNAADGNSFQTTLGVRLTSRIVMGGYGTLIPEMRLGWNHELLDASQQITASLVGVPGSGFSATGIAFDRDAALVGAGFSLKLSPDAKVFVDYDGKLGSRLQEHAVSGGFRIRL